MKLSYSLDPMGRLALLTLRPSESPNDWHAGAVALLANDRFGEDYRIIVDARRVLPLDGPFISRFVGWLADWRARFRNSRWAFLVREGLTYGAARELALQADSRGIRAEAFTDIRRSLGWLRGELDLPVEALIRSEPRRRSHTNRAKAVVTPSRTTARMARIASPQ